MEVSSQCDLTRWGGLAAGVFGLVCVGSAASRLNFAFEVQFRSYIELLSIFQSGKILIYQYYYLTTLLVGAQSIVMG